MHLCSEACSRIAPDHSRTRRFVADPLPLLLLRSGHIAMFLYSGGCFVAGDLNHRVERTRLYNYVLQRYQFAVYRKLADW